MIYSAFSLVYHENHNTYIFLSKLNTQFIIIEPHFQLFHSPTQGFSFPQEAGYPLDSHQATYYLLETHYNNPDYSYDFSSFYRKNLSKQQRNMNIHNGHDGEDGNRDDDDVDDDAGNNHDEQDDYRDDDDEPEAEQQVVDNSGLKLYYTQSLRNFDAGVLSVGIDPNWRHIIPPGQEKVVSEGHCIGACTQQSFPQEGINIFAVMTRTHLIGRQVKLRQVSSSRVLDFSAAPSEGI